jgi:hypothetical protein
MTPRYAATAGEARSGTSTSETMSERHNQSEMKQTEREVKRRLRDLARDMESAQGTATLPQLLDEIRTARSELTYVKTLVEDEIEESRD